MCRIVSNQFNAYNSFLIQEDQTLSTTVRDNFFGFNSIDSTNHTGGIFSSGAAPGGWTIAQNNPGIATLADDATPSVAGGDRFLTGGTTTITDFDDGAEGQVITILAEHAITITDGTNIFLSGSANFTMAASDSLTLICKADGKWYETARSDNS